MHFAPIKNVKQQAILSAHRVEQSFAKAITTQGNQIHGLFSVFVIVILHGFYSTI
ncbi:hypothetical protein [Nitrosomonas sp. Is37]|uniref:hypothetical protein n=1 Tax=Nitrosomonas sp. Is37 TaxID=3080535 RepID=UPI00294ABED8|nr:hypothetical protein [Nitrosomonas sp. Is37]